jgi:hypothetical protein
MVCSPHKTLCSPHVRTAVHLWNRSEVPVPLRFGTDTCTVAPLTVCWSGLLDGLATNDRSAVCSWLSPWIPGAGCSVRRVNSTLIRRRDIQSDSINGGNIFRGCRKSCKQCLGRPSLRTPHRRLVFYKYCTTHTVLRPPALVSLPCLFFLPDVSEESVWVSCLPSITEAICF